MAYSSFSQDAKEFSNEFGANLGWGNPFGTSIEYTRQITKSDLVGAGVGFSMGGAKYGLEYKRLFNTDSKFNPYIGVAGSVASGLSEITVRVNADSALYKVEGGSAIGPRGGFRYQAGWANLYLNVGYGVKVSGGGVEYLDGSRKESIKDFAKLMSVGGVEVSGSMMFRF